MFSNPWVEKKKILITCPRGIVPWLSGEIRALGCPVLTEGEAAVETEGTLAETMRLNLFLRTAHRVLYLLSSFRADNPAALYATLRRLPWEGLLHERGEHAYLSVTSTVDNPTITDARFVNQKAKDAIVEMVDLVRSFEDINPHEVRHTTIVRGTINGVVVSATPDTSAEYLFVLYLRDLLPR